MRETETPVADEITEILSSVEKSISEAVAELAVLRVSVSKAQFTPKFLIHKITEIMKVLEG